MLIERERKLRRRYLTWEDAAARRMIKLWVAEKLGQVFVGCAFGLVLCCVALVLTNL